MQIAEAHTPVRPPVPAASGVGARRAREMGRLVFILPAVVFLAYFAAYPVYTLVRMSLSDVGFDNILGDWRFVGLANYTEAIHRPEFQQALTNTLIYVGVVVVVSMVGGLIAALVVLPDTMPSRVVQSLLLLCWMLPPVVTGGVWKFLFTEGGVVNTMLRPSGLEPGWLVDPSLALYSIAFVNAWAALPFAMIVLKAGLLAVPPDTQEAARVDGAGPVRVFWTVTLPQLRPVALVLTVLIVVYAFRAFDFIFVMTLGGPGTSSMTLPYLAYVDAFSVGYFGRGAAEAAFSGIFTILAAIAYVLVTRRNEVRT